MPITQPSLFSDEAAPPPAPSTDLSLQIKAPQLAPAQLRFNKLLQKIEQLTETLALTEAMADTFRPLYSRTLQPLQAQRDASLLEMVHWLDVRLQNANGLTPAVLRDAKAVVCSLSEQLALAGNDTLRAVYDRHSLQSLANKEKAAAQDIRDMLKRMPGIDVSDDHEGASVQDLLHAGMARLRQQMMDEQADKEVKARTRRGSKPRSAAQQKVLDQQQDAQGALRTIYRQLASALHPDREPDALERLRKTELMGQANAAYERRDLMALLTLQLRCEQIDATAISRLTTDKMAALTLLLKEQAAALQADVFALTRRVQNEFGMSPFSPVTAAGLALELNAQADGLLDTVDLMQDDLRRVQTDAGLKRWIKLQKKMSQVEEIEPDFEGFFR
ncbi:MAG: hypothetical protein H7224_03990 [Polaromonas sp.]|nr:hypothetical protein [Polaromonas sp.]